MESLDDPGVYRIACSKCHDRFCKPCARERAGVVARNLLNHVEKKTLRFITLTLKTQTDDLSLELDRLFASFQQLRRRTFWKRHVAGGAALLEVKYNHDTQRWHPHFHILCEGSFIPQHTLKSEWHHVTGDSTIVDVRAVRDNDRITHYIAKYATDPIDKTVQHDANLIVETIHALKGRRTCAAFGTWAKLKLTEYSATGGWVALRSLNTIIAEARRGINESQAILQALWSYTEDQSKGNTTDGTPRGPPNAYTQIQALANEQGVTIETR
jgi:hypothetical protein